MQGPEVLIPLTIFAGGFAMIFGIEKGMNPKEHANRPAPYRNLKWGLLLIGAGLGLLLAYFLDKFVIADRHDNEALWFALIGIGGGLGLIGSYRIEKKELLDKENRG
jgi:hypothetical protein